ncbi:MAG TPA: hypothetical protein VFM05_06525, partial [Candidatus Saccharimonadales bacterium]|nr:hypothetical protein [Candidatus Saccharimonadales bacterium]
KYTTETFKSPINVQGFKVIAEIRTAEVQAGDWAGEKYHSLHFVVRSMGERIENILEWRGHGTLYGPREGPDWECMQEYWLTQYGYVKKSIRKATVVMALLLCSEAAVAQDQDVEWGPFITEVKEHLRELSKTVANRFPADPKRDGSYSRPAAARIDALMLIQFYLVFMQNRLEEQPTDISEVIGLIEAAATEMGKRGGANNIKVADLPEYILKRLGSKYIELNVELNELISRAKLYYRQNKKTWRDKLVIDYPILKDYPDILDKVDQSCFGAPSDSEASERALQPWEYPWEIAARLTIPDYTPFFATAETLKGNAILPDEQIVRIQD